MRFSENWLREWVDAPLGGAALGHQLTMAGLELDSIEAAAPPFTDIVVGRVSAVEQHPDADRLRVCTVDAGGAEALNIVCGAPNVFAGMLAPVARIGAVLPGGMKIKRSKLRGVVSEGMLCSAAELGLADDASGLLALPQDALPGTDVRTLLDLDDNIIEVDLTPNRGDCLGMAGLAREVGALNNITVCGPKLEPVPAQHQDIFPVRLEAPEGCPIYAGRIVRGIRADAQTPLWLRERLRRAGLRPIHPVVDVTNYVMLELGQPMHGFDLDRLQDGIVVRMATEGEKLTLLDGRELTLDPDVLVIADGSGVKALAGIMGGEDTGVADTTTDVFFECAFFAPRAIAGRARRFGMTTDAAFRYERGVEPGLQLRAIERATELLIAIAGGEAGPTEVSRSDEHVPQASPISLRYPRIAQVLGVQIEADDAAAMLERLGVQLTRDGDTWQALPPPHRFDLAIEEDLIEEIARVYGYDEIPETPATAVLSPGVATEQHVDQDRIRVALADRGFQEAITYSFVEPGLQELLAPGETAYALANPLSADLAVLRVSLWPGLIGALNRNLRRQQDRVRLFEVGVKFVSQDNERSEVNELSLLQAGALTHEQWGQPQAAADFYDLKGEVEALLALTGAAAEFRFVAEEHPALHPGQTARIYRGDDPAGWIGRLHPGIAAKLDIDVGVCLATLDIATAFRAEVPLFARLSDHPAIRRDIAVIVPETVTAADLEAAVRAVAPATLAELRIFDIYRGKGIDSGRKSVALGLILQESSRTLTDREADSVKAAVLSRLEQEFEARIRD